MSKPVNDYFARLTMMPVSTKPWPCERDEVPGSDDLAELADEYAAPVNQTTGN